MTMLKAIVAVGAGSCAGGVLRYLVSRLAAAIGAGSFPAGTFAVNIAGCFIIGLLSGLFDKGGITNTYVRMFLTVGVCGGFTTFSTFMNESFRLMRNEFVLTSATYMAASVAVGYLCVYAGYAAAKYL